MDIIIETDLGGDPDDFFAICYLLSAGVHIKLLNLSPGTGRQVAIARFIFNRLGLDVPVGVSSVKAEPKDRNDMHTRLLQKYSIPLKAEADGNGTVLLKGVLKENPGIPLFLIGPLHNLNEYLSEADLNNNRVLMQGGFVGFNIHSVPCTRLSKFEGYTFYRTTNLDRCIEGAEKLLKANAERYFVGKNICHRADYDRDIHSFFEGAHLNEPMKLFVEAAEIFFEKRSHKKLHDPLAACALLHPEIFTWIRGELTHTDKGWGTLLNENGDHMAVDVDIDAFWEYIIQGC